MGPGMPGQGIALVSPAKSGAIEKILCPNFASKPFRIGFAHADADNLWIGSDLGLLRYDFKAKLWERLLSDLVVTGGCPAERSGLWLLAERFDPVRQDRDGHKLQTERWQITHFVQGKKPEHFPVVSHDHGDGYVGNEIFFSNIVVAESKVWTTEDRFLMDGHGQEAYYPDVYSLDISTRKVTFETDPKVYGVHAHDHIPDAALLNALTGWRVPVPIRMSERFPGWTCASEEPNPDMLALPVPYYEGASARAKDRWSTEGQSGSGLPRLVFPTGPETYWRRRRRPRNLRVPRLHLCGSRAGQRASRRGGPCLFSVAAGRNAALSVGPQNRYRRSRA